MTKQNFYNFAMMMGNDSNILYNSNSYHNSIYLGAFTLEGYIKILFIHKGANTPNGQSINSYGGHINDGKMIERLQSLHPDMFSGSILESSDNNYPHKLLSAEYDINFRYDVNKWTDVSLCQDIQNEILSIYDALHDFRITIGL